MIEFNGKQYSGSIVKNDSGELIISICSEETLPDLCLSLNGVKAVTETTEGGSAVYNVNTATNVGTSVKGIYTITFTKRMNVIEELSNAIDELLLLVLEE